MKLISAMLLVAMSFAAHAEDKPKQPAAPSPDGGQVTAKVATHSDKKDGEGSDKTEDDLVEEVKSREPTVDELIKIKQIWEGMRRVQEKPSGDQPRPVISMTNVNLSPGSTPPMVRISNNTGVIMMFMDMHGRKWPVDHVTNLSENQLETPEKPVDAAKEQSSVYVKAKKFGATGNVAVFLKNFDTPVIITFLAGQGNVDYRVDFRIPASLDNASAGSSDRQEFDDRLASAVMGITPAGCSIEKSDSRSVLAWKCEKDMVIRSSGILLSPATIDGKKASGADGTNAYVIPVTPVVSMMMDGSAKTIKLGGI